jgi:hypothetical protein
MPAPAGPLASHARERLRSLPGVTELVVWHGVWQWTLEYQCCGRGVADATTAGTPDAAATPMVVAYLIPDPVRPRVAVPLADVDVAGLDPRRLARPVREALAHAPSVDGLRWCCWDISSKSLADEIADFLKAQRVASAEALACDAAPPPGEHDGGDGGGTSSDAAPGTPGTPVESGPRPKPAAKTARPTRGAKPAARTVKPAASATKGHGEPSAGAARTRKGPAARTKSGPEVDASRPEGPKIASRTKADGARAAGGTKGRGTKSPSTSPKPRRGGG